MDQTAQNGEIMIVEDDEHIAQLLVFIFQREGFKTILVRDGQAAVQMVEHNAAPALVMLDVMLPYYDGFHLLKKVRAQPGWEQVPIIMLTAKSQENDIVRALDAGANDYVVKPFNPGELLARVRRFLKMKS